MKSGSDLSWLRHEIAIHRNERAYKELFLLFHKRLVRFAFTFLTSNESAEEVYSDTLLKIWNLEERLEEVEDLRVYLYAAIRNNSLSYLSRYKTCTVWDLENIDVALDDSTFNPEELLINNEFRKKVLASVNELPPKCRMAYKLIREDGLSYKEVGRILNISVNTVENHVTAALHKLSFSLRSWLQENG
jgi:RNA polymerase sigma-70 factor (family 1)